MNYLEKFEKSVEDHCLPIKFPDIDKIDGTLENFIENELFKLANLYGTVFVKTNKDQCRKRADRSLGDIYQICKYYFPETTVFDVIRIIFNKIQEKTNSDNPFDQEDPFFVGHYCSMVRKRVWNTKQEKDNYILGNRIAYDEYGYQLSDYFEYLKTKMQITEGRTMVATV